MSNNSSTMAAVSSILAVVFGVAGFAGFSFGLVPTGVVGNLSTIFILQALASFAAVFWISNEALDGHHVAVIEYGVGGLVGFAILAFAGNLTVGSFAGWEGLALGIGAGLAGVLAHEIRGNFLGGSTSGRSTSSSSSGGSSPSPRSLDGDVESAVREVAEEEEDEVKKTEKEEKEEKRDMEMYSDAMDEEFQETMKSLVVDELSHQEDAEEKAKEVEEIMEKIAELSEEHRKLMDAFSHTGDDMLDKRLNEALDSGNPAENVRRVLNGQLDDREISKEGSELKKAAEDIAEIIKLEEEAKELVMEQIQDKKTVLEHKQEEKEATARSTFDKEAGEKLNQEIRELKKDIEELEHIEQVLEKTEEMEEREEERLQRILSAFK